MSCVDTIRLHRLGFVDGGERATRTRRAGGSAAPHPLDCPHRVDHNPPVPSTPPLSDDRAVLLRRHPWSETSLVVHALTRDHGKVHLLARGAHRPKSAFYCVLDLLDELHLEWSTSPRRELGNLRRAELVRRRRHVTDSLERYRAALSILELADLGARAGEGDPELFDELGTELDRLDAGEEGADLPRIRFELAFLRRHGLFPALIRCAACGGPAPPASGSPPRAWFSAGAGGRLCGGCAAEARSGGRRVGTLPLDVLVTADKMCHSEETGTPPPRVDSGRLVRVRDFVERFLDYHLETRPRSHRAFLAAPNRNAPDSSPPKGH